MMRQDAKISFYCLNSNQLKILACCLMLCDHIGYILANDNSMMRAIGRLAFPVFAFLLVEGFRHTSDLKKYLFRLFLFALLSEMPFDLCMTGKILEFGSQNVFFTLVAGLLAIACLEHYNKPENKIVNPAIAFVMLVIITGVAFLLAFDYGGAGVLLVVIFYYMKPFYQVETSKEKWFQAGKVTILSGLLYGLVFVLSEMYALFAILPISMYNGKRGDKRFKYIFYLFYPVHLLIIWGIHKFLLT